MFMAQYQPKIRPDVVLAGYKGNNTAIAGKLQGYKFNSKKAN